MRAASGPGRHGPRVDRAEIAARRHRLSSLRPVRSRSKVNSALIPHVGRIPSSGRWVRCASWYLVVELKLRRPCCLRGEGFACPCFPFREGMERRGGASGACATRSLWHPLRSGCRVSCEDTRPWGGQGLRLPGAPPAARRLRKAPCGERVCDLNPNFGRMSTGADCDRHPEARLEGYTATILQQRGRRPSRLDAISSCPACTWRRCVSHLRVTVKVRRPWMSSSHRLLLPRSVSPSLMSAARTCCISSSALPSILG